MDKNLVKNRVLIGVAIVLIVLNITTLATIVWQSKKIDQWTNPPKRERAFSHKSIQEITIKRLGLDSNQAKLYYTLDSIFRERSKQIFDNMQQIRKDMMSEILKDNPDTVRLSALSKQLAIQHISLKNNTFEFLLGLKKICNPKQQDALNEYIQRMLEFEGMPLNRMDRRHFPNNRNKKERPGERHDFRPEQRPLPPDGPEPPVE
jgi:Spy/CpxP family protein refolding chaperone